jgi:acyl-CoA reductase-like NAD-dependent aldehyde dehydrogenase
MIITMSTTSTPTLSLPDAVARCRREQQQWARLAVRQRLRPLDTLRRLLASECNALCAAVSEDLGKTPEETIAGDILPLAAACRFLVRNAAALLRPHRVPWSQRPFWLWGQSDVIHRRPRGVVGVIGTWNYPLLLNGVAIVHALTAGNGVVWKPSEVVPASTRLLFDLIERAGFPPGLVHFMPPTRAGGAELAEADVEHMAFTGSSTTGRVLARRLGERLVSSTLELSGCDAMWVLDDADVSLASRAAWFGATGNRGQTCLAVRRAFVHHSLYPAFIEALRPLARAAPPLRMALASQTQQAVRLVQEAVAEGARLLDGAPAINTGDAQLCQPVLVLDVRPEMSLCREASFAPLLALLPFDTIEEALLMDRQCPYGLGASIFTRSPERGAKLAAELRTGTVAINDVIVPTAHPATPFGGCGDSGWGVTQGAEGLLEMTVPQVVSVRSGTFRPHYDFAAGCTLKSGEMLRAFLDAGHGATFGQRWGGMLRLLRSLWRGS